MARCPIPPGAAGPDASDGPGQRGGGGGRRDRHCQGREVRYHHLGPLGPAACWDRWEGAVFRRPGPLRRRDSARALRRGHPAAPNSRCSPPAGRARPARGRPWCPADVARTARLPGGASGRLPRLGRRDQAARRAQGAPLRLNLAGALLSGVADRDQLRPAEAEALAGEASLSSAACSRAKVRAGTRPPGRLGPSSRRGPPGGGRAPGGRRRAGRPGGPAGFLSSQNRLTDRGTEGPLIVVAGGRASRRGAATRSRCCVPRAPGSAGWTSSRTRSCPRRPPAWSLPAPLWPSMPRRHRHEHRCCSRHRARA